MELDPATWRRLGHDPPRQVVRLTVDRGMSAVLFACDWPDLTGVLKVSRQRARGARERRALTLLHGSRHVPRLLEWLERDDDVLLLLEDLRSCATDGDILIGVNPTRACAVMHALGELHARHREERPPGWVDAAPGWRDTRPHHLEAFLVRNPHPWGSAHLNELLARRDEERLHLSSLPRTVIHADAHLDNWMFRASGAPVLLDWETARVGPGIIDVARFFIEGVHADVRRPIHRQLLSIWCDHVGEDLARAERSLRAAVWWSLNAMIPHHATVDLEKLPQRMRRVHRHCARQALDLAEDLFSGQSP